MPDLRGLEVREGEVLPLTITFNEGTADGDGVTPTAIKYTLLDYRGEVVNGRNSTAITPADQEVKITLTQDDLLMVSDDQVERRQFIMEIDHTGGLKHRESWVFFIRSVRALNAEGKSKFLTS